MSDQSSESQWISISDMMSGLMLIFLFVAVTYMVHVTRERDKIKEIAILYNRTQTQLYEELKAEFEDDLDNWNAKIDSSSLSIRFDSPEILFPVGSSLLTARFRTILKDFFPRYVAILTSDDFIDHIEEVRIEGHTSSEWPGTPKSESYLLNMRLSQDRTREVLSFCFEIPAIKREKKWLKSRVTANGLSSSKLVLDDEGKEDRDRSRRVEFRVRTNAEQQLIKILETN
jgi:outer membrane protein OmpA-like peptidoglycan-associated protein